MINDKVEVCHAASSYWSCLEIFHFPMMLIQTHIAFELAMRPLKNETKVFCNI